MLLTVLPLEGNGAMETFLLNAIAQEDAYEKEMIEKYKMGSIHSHTGGLETTCRIVGIRRQDK